MQTIMGVRRHFGFITDFAIAYHRGNNI
jgi:hypothetical protein